MNASLSIIIVNYRTPDLIIQCVESIKKHLHNIEKEIIIVDNNSCDDSKNLITNEYSDVIWIQNLKNEGFGRANNKGISYAKHDLILLLNSDTIIIDNSIHELVIRYISEPKSIKIASCQLINQDYILQKSVFFKNSAFSEILLNNLLFDYFFGKYFKSRKAAEIKALHGACLIFDRKRMNDIGYFDEDFFLYAEEFELCHRVRKRGGKLKHYSDLKIIHLEGESSISSEWNINQRMISTALLYRKNRGFFGYLLFLFLCIGNIIINSIFLWKMNSNYRKDFLCYIKRFFSYLPIYFNLITLNFEPPLRICDKNKNCFS